jgi:hypothetical protein
MRFKSVLGLIFVFNALHFNAQYTIKGKIFSVTNKEPLPFVAVLIKGTNYGAQTDFDGNFIIKTPKLGDSIVASYVGYRRLSRPINKSLKEQEINFPLSNTEGVSLDEVVVLGGDNPAHRIIRKCVDFKAKNNKYNLKAFEYESYNKLEFDLTRIPKEMRNKKILKPLSFIFDNIDSTFSSEKPSLPFFIIESLSNFYYKSNPKRKKEIVTASKITGLENSSVSQVLGDMYQNVNLYENNIIIFNKQFPSPISENALFYYKYYLLDSAFEGNQYIYHISFKPKRTQELSFTGNIWIADTTWGVKRIEMSLPKDANINFINNSNVIQEYAYADSTWSLVKDRLVIDFAPTKKAIGFYGRKTSSYKKIKLNEPKDDKFYEFAEKFSNETGISVDIIRKKRKEFISKTFSKILRPKYDESSVMKDPDYDKAQEIMEIAGEYLNCCRKGYWDCDDDDDPPFDFSGPKIYTEPNVEYEPTIKGGNNTPSKPSSGDSGDIKIGSPSSLSETIRKILRKL